MAKSILAIAPHPDDETLGCGGTLLRHVAGGDAVHWLIVTSMSTEYGFAQSAVERRAAEIQDVAKAYGFAGVHTLNFPATRLDAIPMSDLVAKLSAVMKSVAPEVLYLPFRGDVHTDHRVVFDTAVSCTKWFRYPSIRRILAYETLSETDFGVEPAGGGFTPNYFVDVSSHFEKKLKIAALYGAEMGQFPFPRSEVALRALGQVRGAACGSLAAEAFRLIKEIVRD